MRHIAIVTRLALFTWICSGVHSLHAQNAPKQLPVYVKDRKLAYTPDSLGNRVPDFSYCGYRPGTYPIPEAPIKIIVPAVKGDATFIIQNAIDEISKLPANELGVRGAVQLQKGVYHVEGSLKLHTSGVVLRGSGFGEDGTVIIGEG